MTIERSVVHQKWNLEEFSRHAGMATVVLVLAACLGCATKLEPEGIPPEVFSSKAPLSRSVGKVGVNLAATDITIVTPTTGTLFKKEVWNKIVRGSLTGLQMYRDEIQPVTLLVSDCWKSQKDCRDSAIVLGSLALVAITAGGIVGATQVEYSESLAQDLEQSLLQSVSRSNDELRNSIVSASRALAFQSVRERNGDQDWAIQAFSRLNSVPVVEILPRAASSPADSSPFPFLPNEEQIESVLDARVGEVLFTDDDEWFSSKVELRVRAKVSMFRTDNMSILDQREYECVSVPRSLKFWSMDSYRHVREEIVACNQLLGRQIANELLLATVRSMGR